MGTLHDPVHTHSLLFLLFFVHTCLRVIFITGIGRDHFSYTELTRSEHWSSVRLHSQHAQLSGGVRDQSRIPLVFARDLVVVFASALFAAAQGLIEALAIGAFLGIWSVCVVPVTREGIERHTHITRFGGSSRLRHLQFLLH